MLDDVKLCGLIFLWFVDGLILIRNRKEIFS